jgi:predicted small lipoprotein YifL
MYMKKYLCVMLAVILCFSVTAGCGQKTAGTDKPAV